MPLKRGTDQQLGRMIIHGTARMIGGRLARMAITLGGVAVLARLLTPADFGIVAVAAMILPLANALLEGLIDVPTIREDSLDRNGLSNLIWSGVLLMAGLCVLLWFAAPGLSALLNSPELADVLRVLCFGLLLQPFITASHAVLRRQHKFGASALFMPIAGAAYVLTAICFALVGYGFWSLIFGQLFSLIIAALGLVVISKIPVRPPSRLQARTAWQMGGLGFVTRLMTWVSANIDTLFASAALGAASTGIYSRAYNLTTQIKEPFAVLDHAVRQAFVAQRELRDDIALRSNLAGLRLVVLVAVLVAASTIVMRDAVVTILLGAQWAEVVLPLAVLASSLPARVARLYLDGLTYVRGSMGYMLARNIILVVMLVMGLWFWAGEGVLAIASVVALVHIAALFFSGGSVDVVVAGSARQRILVMLPAYIYGVGMVLVGEAPALIGLGLSPVAELCFRAAVCATFFCLLLAFTPDKWLPQSFIKMRRGFLGRVRAL